MYVHKNDLINNKHSAKLMQYLFNNNSKEIIKAIDNVVILDILNNTNKIEMRNREEAFLVNYATKGKIIANGITGILMLAREA